MQKYFVLSTDNPEAATERAAAVLTSKHAAAAPLEYIIEPPSTLAGAEPDSRAGGLMPKGHATAGMGACHGHVKHKIAGWLACSVASLAGVGMV